MSKINVGIVLTELTNLTPYLQLVYVFGRPELILCDNRKGSIDVLIIPDGIGAYVGMGCFAGVRTTAISIDHMCPMAEIFRLGGDQGLDYYIGREIPIIGVGEGAIMLWNHLGQKAKVLRDGSIGLDMPTSKGIEVLKREHNYVVEWRTQYFYGVPSLESPLLYSVLREIKQANVRHINETWAGSEVVLPPKIR